ncbi:MAG TPA: hypothetical protein VK419_13540 [Bryobacteraceae bacterium]|nr:hypothetical protein [Bryobacteraceae bacterium]
MKRIVTFLSLAFFLAVPMVLRAQSEAGTWKLNTAKSKYSGVATPKSRTQTWESQDGGVKHHTEGVAGDGSAIDYSFSAKYDGTDNPVTGRGAPSDADTVALKRVDTRTTETTWKKGGKVVGTSRNSVSKNGKVMTVNARGTNPDGTKNNVKAVYEKQ